MGERRASLIHWAMRLAILLSCFWFTACESGDDTWCGAAPLSQVQLTDKLAFTGPWSHTATVLEVEGDPALVVGTHTEARAVTFDFSEERLVARDESGAVLSLLIDDHFTAGFLSTGEQCVVSDERPWSEKRYMRVDYSTDQREPSSGLPFMAERVEAIPYVTLGEDGEAQVVVEDDLVIVPLLYVADTGCDGCGFSEVTVEHRFQRIGI